MYLITILPIFYILLGFITDEALSQEMQYELQLSPKYHLAWGFSKDEETVYFEAVVETRGYVGFAVSRSEGMTQSDLGIGGYNGSECYYGDYFAMENAAPILDADQDWFATYCSENETHTTIHHYRNLYTGGTWGDIRIVDEEVPFLWAIGSTDDLTYHGKERGYLYLNLFNPNKTEPATSTTVSKPSTGPTSVN